MHLKEEIGLLVQEKLSSTDNFLVDIKVGPGKIAVIIDHPTAVSIEDCATINRYIHEKLDDSGVFEKCELEVGSPGMEEPLKILPQYKKRIGQKISILTFDGLKHMGKLLNADEKGVEFEEEKTSGTKKNKEIIKNNITIPFTDIKETRVIFSFEKI